MDPSAARRPLDEAAEDIRRLEDYDDPDQLAAALGGVAAAVERALRIRLRADRDAPEEHRLSALSPAGLSLNDIVASLRARDLISIETAGAVHQLQAAAERAGEGAVRAADADIAREAVERLRRELPAEPEPEAEAEPEAAGAAANAGPGTRMPGSEPVAVPAARRADTSGQTGRWVAWLAAAVAAFALLGAAWVVLRGGSREYDDARTAFRAGRLDSAAVGFERVLEDRPEDVSVLLYLARTYRRLDRPGEAADVLQRAAAVDPEDADVRRELGHLFMDLGRPTSAVRQYERALEQEPEEALNWAALIRALRELEDPRAEQLLRDAPAEVQAALGGG